MLLLLTVGLSVGSTGCKSSGGSKNSNPFAMDRQTVPPPATFSHQSSYLGQTPGSYNPQQPATVYPSGTTAPASIPSNVPLPSSTTAPATTPIGAGSYGSINGASTFSAAQVPTAQLASHTAPVASEWQPTVATLAETNVTVPVTSTSQTVFQYLDSKVGTVATVSADGSGHTVAAAPETLVVSSSQAVTKISDPAPISESVPAVESQSLYTAW